jgi:hypothetical protein
LCNAAKTKNSLPSQPNKTLHSSYSVMGLSFLGVTFSSTIISCCTCDFECADVRGVVAVAAECWRYGGDSACGDGDGDGDGGCHGPTGMVKVCAAVYLIYSFLA